MATFNKIEQFVLDLGLGVHNLNTGALTLALTAAANPPSTSADLILGDLTEISYTNLSTRVLAGVSYTETTGTGKLVITDHVLTASGGAVAAFRYIVIYNDTPSSPLDPLIGWYDFGSDLTLADTETLTIDFDASGGVLTLI